MMRLTKVLNKFNNFKFVWDDCLIIIEGSSKVDALRDSVDECVTLVKQQSEKIKPQGAILTKLIDKEPITSENKKSSSFAEVAKRKSSIILLPSTLYKNDTDFPEQSAP
jgi:hypothetical protein